MKEKINIILTKIKDAKKGIIKTAVKVLIFAGIACGITGAVFYGYVKANINYSKSEAAEIALTSIAGEVVSSRIDLDDGILEYEFKIKDVNNRLYEVKVDSKYGAISDIDYND